jgi:hypothetical protein
VELAETLIGLHHQEYNFQIGLFRLSNRNASLAHNMLIALSNSKPNASRILS